jgi:hypothetical protein
MSTESEKLAAKTLIRTSNAFKTPQSTDRHHAIAERGLILLTEVGSTLHGVSTDATGDDRDEMGVCIEPPSCVIGLDKFEMYEYRTQPVNVRSGPGDVDRAVYSLRKWAKLAAAGNPTVLMMLFAPVNKVVYCNSIGHDLRANADLFITRQAGERFLGYLQSQRRRYLSPTLTDSKHASRPELMERYGWDTKTGYHALRLAYQGTELMRSGRITLPMPGLVRDFLLEVRLGKWTKDQVTGMIDEQASALREAMYASGLPESPDLGKINGWLSNTYRAFWDAGR